MTTSTKTSPSRNEAYRLQREVDKLAYYYKTLRNRKTTELLQKDKLRFRLTVRIIRIVGLVGKAGKLIAGRVKAIQAGAKCPDP